MDHKKEHRRRRLIELLEMFYQGERGHQSRAAERIEVDRNYLSRLLSSPDKSGHKNIGEDLQDRIEQAFDLPAGWLDLPLGTPLTTKYKAAAQPGTPPTAQESPPVYPLQESKLEKAIAMLRSMSEADQADVIWYINCVSQKHPTRSHRAGLPVPAPTAKTA